MLGIGLVLFLALRARLASLVYRGVDLLPPGWDGRFPGGGVFGMLLGRLRRPGVPPRLACA